MNALPQYRIAFVMMGIEMIFPYQQRRSPRLQGYDYSQAGAYFVTICAHNRTPLFGTIADGVMQLNAVGLIAAHRWEALPEHHADVELDAFVVMPNHVHGILILTATMPALPESKRSPVASVRLGTLVGSYKSGVTRRIRDMGLILEGNVWQGRYHDHIIRNEVDLNRIRAYVEMNPQCWAEDKFYQ